MPVNTLGNLGGGFAPLTGDPEAEAQFKRNMVGARQYPGAGLLPAAPGVPTVATLGNYIGASGPRAVTGPARGSPAGPPVQALDAPNLALTRERIQRELMDNPALQRRFDANTTAEVGTNPEKRRWYQALTIDRAVQTGAPLAEIVNNPNYYPSTTTSKTAATGMGVDASLFEGANPANYATGNASFDPKTGRWVGFAGGPQTSTFGSGRTMELAGIEGQGAIPYAREMGYLGPTRTAIGPAGPRGPEDTTPLAGWEATVGTETPGGGSVGYTGRRTYGDPVPQASSTSVPADAPRSWEQILADFASGLGTMRPVQVKPIEAPKFTQMAPFTPLGRGVETFR